MNTGQLRDAIHRLTKEEQIQVLDFLVKRGVKTNGNKSGTFINLSVLSADILEELLSLTNSLNPKK